MAPTPRCSSRRRRRGELPAEALAWLDDSGARYAVVVRDGRLGGLVTRAELARLRGAEAQQQA